MHINTLYVTPAIGRVSPRPKINLSASWLFDMGFTPGALVQVIPEPGGISFVLRDEYIMKYSDLYSNTKEKGGVLIIVNSISNMEVSGKCISNAGLDINDSLIALYDYGLIKARKLPTKAKVIPINKDNHSIRITGKWLSELGFAVGAVVTAAINPDSVAFKLQEGGIGDYKSIVKHARENKEKVLQVHMEGYTQCLEVDAGFDACDAFIAICEYGVISITPFNAEQLGFDKTRGLLPHYID